MGKFPYVSIILLGLIINPSLALASEDNLTALETISIPAETQASKLKLNVNYSESTLLQDSSLTTITDTHNSKKKIKGKLCSLNRKFGPLDLGLKVNPFNFNSSGLVVGLDVLRSYEILSSKPSLDELTEAFKPAPNQYLIHPEMKAALGKILVSINDKLNPLASPELKVQ